MAEEEFRPGKKHFYDNKKFPRGFAKSGDFTIPEEAMLIQFGETMQNLELGILEPTNEAEKQFIVELSSEGGATSKLAKVWLKYVKLSRGRKRFHTLHGHNKSDASDDYNDEDDEPLIDDD